MKKMVNYMIYLDNAATTRVSESAAEAAKKAMCQAFGNPSSLHALGIEAEGMVRAARERVAAILSADKNEIIFTSGGTEGNNLAILGSIASQRRKKHIVTSELEHASVLEPMRALEAQGFEVTYLKHDEITPDGVAQKVRDDTALVSLMTVNNEVGALYPISDIARAVKRKCRDVIFHTDAVQAFCKVPINVRSGDIDLLTLSGHKIHAPKGIGALYVRRGVRIKGRNLGGGQEKGLRSGTENVPAIVALGAAADGILDMSGKLDYLKEKLSTLPEVKILFDANAPHILSVAVCAYPSEVTMRILEEHGIYVSSGSACSKGKRSYVLKSLGVAPNLIDSAIRVSICEETTKEDIDAFVNAVENIRR